MEFDYAEAYKHSCLIAGDEHTPITWQVFFDPNNMGKRFDLAKNWTQTLRESYFELIEKQSHYCGVYLTVNETDGKGRNKENITKIRFFVVDYDGQAEPNWSIEPTFKTNRDATHGHAYWRVSDECPVSFYPEIQKRISLYYNSDHRIIDLSRVFRLCGSLHYKDANNPKMYRITGESGKSYSTQEFIDAHMLGAVEDAKLNQWIKNKEANKTGEGFTDNPRYLTKLAHYAANIASPAILGCGGDTLLRSCLYARDLGITVKACQDIFWEHYNPRCEPPWDDNQHSKTNFYDIIENGYSYAGNAAGCKTAIGSFSELPPIDKPVEGWEENKSLALPVVATGNVLTDHRISRSDGELLLSQCTIKSAHYDLVRAFDGMVFDGCKLIRAGEIFYAYNDDKNVWEQLGKDIIRALIQRFFSEYKPSDTFTNGIFNVLKDFVNVRDIENGIWLSDPEKECDNLTLFKNGIVDFTDINNIIIHPHTSDFFSLNNVGYDWDITAKCPVWESFLSTVWDTDATRSNANTLQEFMGYMLVNDMSLQCFLFLLGVPRSGKSLITKVMTNVIGKANTCTPALDKLNQDSTIHHIIKSKLAIIPDAHSVNRMNRDPVLSQLKAMSGQDDISYHEMYIGSKTAEIKAKLVLTANSMPEFIDSSGALADRAIPIVFHNSFVGREDRTLASKLLKETAAICCWAMIGLKRLRTNNNIFTQSQDSKEELIEIKEDLFPLSQFIKQCCKIAPDVEISNDTLYSAYQLFATLNGIKLPFTKIQFTKCLRTSSLPLTKFRGVIEDTDERVTGFRGIRLNDQTLNKMGIGGFTPIP